MTQREPYQEHLPSLINSLAASFAAREHADVVAAALIQAGFAEEEIHVLYPEQVDEIRAPHGNVVHRLLMLLEDAATTQVARRASFVHLLEQGESVLIIHCPSQAQLNTAHQIVRHGGGLNITHSGRWTTEHLPS